MKANAYDLTRLCWSLAAIDGHLSPVVPQRDVIALGNAPGLDGPVVRVTGRDVVVDLEVRPDSLAERHTILDRLWRRLGGVQELESDDLPGRVIRSRLSNAAVSLYTGAYALPAASISLTFTATDPAKWEAEPLVYGLSTARTACPIGTELSAPQVWIYGTCTNPEVIVRAASGAEVARLTFAVSLGSTGALWIDSASQTITRTVAGVVQTGAASGLAVLASGTYPLLSPEDATPDGTVSPTVELTASSGTPTGLIRYHRRWT